MIKKEILFWTIFSVNFSNNGDQLISGGNDKQVIIWKTNFDQEETDKTAKQASKSKSPKKKTKSALEERISADIGPVYGEPGNLEKNILFW